MKTVIIGAGAVGGCVGAWLTEKYDEVYLIDQGEVAKHLKENGLTLYKQFEEDAKKNISVKVVDSLGEVDNPDVIMIAVKNYNLEEVAQSVAAQIQGDPIIVGFQNGVLNQTVLPKYFKKVVYGVVEFNAWFDEPGVIGYQNKGPFVLGCIGGGLEEELAALQAYMNAAAETEATDRIRDAAYCKMVINLTNSYTTLVGFKYREISSLPLFKKVLSNSMYEGIQVLKAMGIKEYSAGDMPTWSKIKASATMPDFITMGIFKKNLAKMVLSSMAQDILQRKTGVSELESLVGEFVRLAEEYKVPAPYNKTVYQLCQQEFAKPEFVPLTEEQVWEAVKKNL
ncbi:MAG: 2-dehydropantoate 2-reductase [Coriobacteriia bacterium]|nr:2-dehydropantoate 2-reductase [Coriobacteriia bacterium]MCL2750897.1 2-dehydropantoate 2-reductase [Coriobacteriia bacterium]